MQQLAQPHGTSQPPWSMPVAPLQLMMQLHVGKYKPLFHTNLSPADPAPETSLFHLVRHRLLTARIIKYISKLYLAIDQYIIFICTYVPLPQQHPNPSNESRPLKHTWYCILWSRCSFWFCFNFTFSILGFIACPQTWCLAPCYLQQVPMQPLSKM